MPSMANLTLQNNAGTNVTATALTPSAGDSVAAKWRVETTAVPPGFRPTMAVMAKANEKTKGSRRVHVDITVPVTLTDISGAIIPQAQIKFVGDFYVPQNIVSAPVDDTVAYIKTFFASALVLDTLKSQIAPT